MSNIPYELVRAEEGKVAIANDLKFEPFLPEKPYHFSVVPEATHPAEIFRIARGKQEKPKAITGQTRLDRYPALFRAAVKCIQSARPGQIKHILSAPSSIGAEAVSLAAKVKYMDLLHEYQFECVDINERYINHARTFQFPAGMLIRQSGWLQGAFERSDKPPNDYALWVQPTSDIRDAIKIHEPADMAEFQSEKKYDIVFMMTLFTHLTANQQTAVLENMMLQCNGLLCFDCSAPVMDDDPNADQESFEQSLNRVRDILKREGYSFADPFQSTIQPGTDKFVTTGSDFSSATIAIHPELVAQIV